MTLLLPMTLLPPNGEVLNGLYQGVAFSPPKFDYSNTSVITDKEICQSHLIMR